MGPLARKRKSEAWEGSGEGEKGREGKEGLMEMVEK